MTMRTQLSAIAALLILAAPAAAQDIVKVPASQSGVALPEDIFNLPPGQWYVARQVSQGSDPCTADACEAGFNSGNLAVSVEHAKGYVQVIAGFRGCEAVAFQEVQTGLTPGSSTRSEVSHLLKKVVKAAEQSCKLKAPKVPKLDVASLFPAKGG
jgi:hypothetical protein